MFSRKAHGKYQTRGYRWAAILSDGINRSLKRTAFLALTIVASVPRKGEIVRVTWTLFHHESVYLFQRLFYVLELIF